MRFSSQFLKAKEQPREETRTFRGLPIVIENHKGTIRTGTNPEGESWYREMKSDYGYVEDTSGSGDREPLDVYVGEDESASDVYIVEQIGIGEPDEYKLMLGYPDLQTALDRYLENYPEDWEEEHVGQIWAVPFEEMFSAVEEHQGLRNHKEAVAIRKFCGSKEEALHKVVKVLGSSGIGSLVIGGIAVQEHGFPRNTIDIDLVVSNIQKAEQILIANGYETVKEKAGTPGLIVFRDLEYGGEIDLLQGGKPFLMGKVSLPMPRSSNVTPEICDVATLIDLKIDAFLTTRLTGSLLRDQDKVDVQRLIMQSNELPRDLLRGKFHQEDYEWLWDKLHEPPKKTSSKQELREMLASDDGLLEFYLKRTAAAPPLVYELIQDFLKYYESQQEELHAIALAVEHILINALAKEGIKAIVTSRVKRNKSVKKKLLKRQPVKQYRSLSDILLDVKDFVGVRISLYFPADKTVVDKIIQESFELARPPKIFPRDADPEDGYDYIATHYTIRFAKRLVEIQVASLLMAAWTEIMHDLTYKPTIKLSPEELAMLENLHITIQDGDAVLEDFQQKFEDRTQGKLQFALTSAINKIQKQALYTGY